MLRRTPDKPTLTAGLGLKLVHFAQALACSADGLWFEVHAENYMAAGGPRLAGLTAVAERHPVALHGVGLSLAADEAPSKDHLAALRRLADRLQPVLVSEHLAWSARGGSYLPDLLPFPRSRAALDRICANVDRMQTVLQRQVLIENPSLYLPLAGNDYDEVDFLTRLCARTGCGLLVDVNNVYVSTHNVGGSAHDYLDALPAHAVGEIHLAGHAEDGQLGPDLLIDTHGAPVAEAVWALFERLILRIGPRPTLIERDADIPPFDELLIERGRAHHGLQALHKAAALV